MTRLQFFFSVLLLSLLSASNTQGQTIKNGSIIECKSYRSYTQEADGSNRLFLSYSNYESYGERRKYNRFQFLLEDNLILQQNWFKDEVYEIVSPFYDYQGNVKGWLVIKRSDPDYPTIILLESDEHYIKILAGYGFSLRVWDY